MKITSIMLPSPATSCLRSLPVWIVLSLLTLTSKAQNAKQMTDSGFQKMTIIRVYPDYSKEYAEVIFSESARFYQLPRTEAMYEGQLKMLQAAYKKRKAVWVRTTVVNGVVIKEVRECTGRL